MKKFCQNNSGFLLLFFFYLFINPGCGKVEESVIPSIPFTYTINLTIHNEINVPGNSIFIPEIGYGGVIVYCESPDSFYAFDATCTNEVSTSCLVKNEGVLGTCQCCKSQYMLIGGGYPSSGPAKQGLRQYHTSLFNGMLRIYNN
jgi:Rieske Fe-S protein